MAVCELCGNDYERTIEIIGSDGRRHVFDSFECAIHAIAPRCGHCGCAIIGHGLDGSQGQMFCCRHCEAAVTGKPKPEGSAPPDGTDPQVSPFTITPD